MGRSSFQMVLALLLTLVAVVTSASVRQPTEVQSVKKTTGDMSLQVVNAVTRFLSIFPVKDRVVSALSAPVARAYDALRPGLKAVGIAYLTYQALAYLLPVVIGGWGSVPSGRDSGQGSKGESMSISEAIGELGIGAVAQSLQALNLTSRSSEILSTWEVECKRRAACELGKSLADRIPYVAWILGYFGPRFPLIGPFADAFSEGISRPECSRLYQECPYLRASQDT